MNTLDHLTELLNQKDTLIAAQAQKIEDLERRMSYGLGWMLQHHAPAKDDALPVPRLQLKLLSTEKYSQEWGVNVVLPGRDDVNSYIPYTGSRASRSNFDKSAFPLEGFLSDEAINLLPTILSDLRTLAEATSIPAFIEVDSSRVYKLTALRPLVIEKF